MHPNSMNIMSTFATTHLDNTTSLNILDVGSMNVNGSYNKLFCKPNWIYKGIDISEGLNVDIVSPDPYKWPVDNNSFDVIISGQCMEHVEAPWLWVKEIERVCKPNGLICIIAPWNFVIHRYPVDCWRILPDGMEYIFTKHCTFKKIECGVIDIDCYFIGIKQ